MTTFAELKAQHIANLEHELAFKEAALRYCRHSKKQARLFRQVKELKSSLRFMRGELNEAEMQEFMTEVEEEWE